LSITRRLSLLPVKKGGDHFALGIRPSSQLVVGNRDDEPRSYETESTSTQRFNEAGTGRIVVQYFTQFVDDFIQTMRKVSVGLVRPKQFDQLRARDG
jgi:hypothetical protein